MATGDVQGRRLFAKFRGLNGRIGAYSPKAIVLTVACPPLALNLERG